MKVVQVNVSANWGSTGVIAEQIGRKVIQAGGESWIAYRVNANESKSNLIRISPKWGKYTHYALQALFDSEGLHSNSSTHKLISHLESIEPDIVHLHNIHDHWLNYEILFKYLNETTIKVVWTFHDFWPVTGHCAHFVQKECDRFKTECHECPYTNGKLLPFFKQSRRNFNLKKRLFSSNTNLTVVPVSEWVGENVQQSFLKGKEIRVIPNGVDISVFKPTTIIPRYHFKDKFVIMAVSSQWKSGSKGLEDFIAMSKILRDDEIIVLVGVPDNLTKFFPENVIGIRRTNNQQELAALYTRADVICSFSSAETFGLTIIEGYACGTPAVVYNNTAPPSLVTPDTGFVVPNKDYKSAYEAIQKIRKIGKDAYSDNCIKIVREKYDKEKCFEKYIKLYRLILNL